MTKEEFKQWENDVHCALFHVLKSDLDDTHNVRIDQLRVVEAIAESPGVLKHMTLDKILTKFDVYDSRTCYVVDIDMGSGNSTPCAVVADNIAEATDRLEAMNEGRYEFKHTKSFLLK